MSVDMDMHQQAMENASENMRRFGEALLEIFDKVFRTQAEIVRKGMENAGLFVTITPNESVYRAYAARLNWRRRYRKVSWRRLNARQRAEAIAAAFER